MEMVERCLLMIIKQSKVSRGEKKTYDIKYIFIVSNA